jgi:quercetin dioxygenase-like cupin family protein
VLFITEKERTMFYHKADSGFKQPLAGVAFKTLVYGERTLFTEFRLKKDAELPRHQHPYEQTGYLVSGKIRLTITDEVFDVTPGDAWCVPENAWHRAEILEDSIAIEVFSPIREDYLP